MSDEGESADPVIAAAERAIITLLSDRDANEAMDEGEREDREANEAFDEEEREDRGTSAISLFPRHPASAIPVKQKKTAEELEAMIHQDLSQLEGWPERAVKVTVYGFNPWHSMLTSGVERVP